MIGRGFKIPDETLNQFEDLSNPLLEVIVHWLKGTGNTLPSWEVLISILQDPSVDEAERAGKIQRLYCNYREEEATGNERKADSGKKCSGCEVTSMDDNIASIY